MKGTMKGTMKSILTLIASLVLIGCNSLPLIGCNKLDTNLPSNPGREGRQTLEGIDSDGDGVRDDVQIAIQREYPDVPPQTQRALAQMAKAIQQAMLAGDKVDMEIIELSIIATGDGINCLFKRTPKGSEPVRQMKFIQAQVVNTPERFKAYNKYNKAVAGPTGRFSSGSDNPQPCI